MEVFGKGALLASTHHPRQREGSAFVDHVDHQGHTHASHDAASDDEHQRLEGEMREQELGRGQKIDVLGNGFIVYPSAQALDAAVGLGAIRDFRRDGGQLRALAGDHTPDEGGQGGQVPGAWPLWLPRIALGQGSPYGTILAEGVTHRMLLRFCCALTMEYTM